MTGEHDFRLTIGINSDILWKTQYDKSLHDIPKIFLFDAARFPASFKNPNKSKYFTFSTFIIFWDQPKP
jgi:hypothetical protein